MRDRTSTERRLRGAADEFDAWAAVPPRAARLTGLLSWGSLPLAAAVLLAAALGLASSPRLPVSAPIPAVVATAAIALSICALRALVGGAIAEREEALRQAELLGHAARELNSSLDPDEVIGAAVRLTKRILATPGSTPHPVAFLPLRDGVVTIERRPHKGGRIARTTWQISPHTLVARAAATAAPAGGPLDAAKLPPELHDFAGFEGMSHATWIPVIVDADAVGVLGIAGPDAPLAERQLSRCEAVAEMLNLALTNAIAHEGAQLAALTDPLTSVANRRGLQRMVQERRGRRCFAVLSIDVDGLKQVNDSHGHATGDRLLMHVARTVGAVLRDGDVLARVGGDEFAAVVFDADEQAAQIVADRILDAIGRAQTPLLTPRASIGVACGSSDDDLAAVVDEADAAMYEAKRAGGMRHAGAPIAPTA